MNNNSKLYYIAFPLSKMKLKVLYIKQKLKNRTY